jgi:uncharacterized protein YlxP (DUF503 family)
VRIPWAQSLKDRRQVARSLVQRLGRQPSLAIAELSTDEDPRRLDLGLAAVSGSAAHARELIGAAVRAIEGQGYELELRLDGEL